MDEEEARQLIYDKYFGVVGQSSAARPTIEEFFLEKIGESLDIPGSLEGWDTFLKESLAVEIQRSFIDQGFYIQRFTSQWLIEHEKVTWEALIEHMRTNLVETE